MITWFFQNNGKNGPQIRNSLRFLMFSNWVIFGNNNLLPTQFDTTWSHHKFLHKILCFFFKHINSGWLLQKVLIILYFGGQLPRKAMVFFYAQKDLGSVRWHSTVVEREGFHRDHLSINTMWLVVLLLLGGKITLVKSTSKTSLRNRGHIIWNCFI